GSREGRAERPAREGGSRVARPGPPDRRDQDARPQRHRPRRRHRAGRGDRPVDGHRDHGLRKAMTKHGKTLVDAGKRYDRERLYNPAEAFDLVKNLSTRKFDETVEVAFRLGVDPRKADQMIRGTVSLPNGTGKAVRVAVFAAGDAAREA